MKVLLLGATGLLGHNVLRALDEHGHRVVALVRHVAALRLPAGSWQLLQGSLLNPADLHRAAEGCEAVINCAGTTDMSLLHPSDYDPVNSQLPAMLEEVMQAHSIRILVHISTINTIGNGTCDCPSDESAPMSPPFTGSHYAVSKWRGEQAVVASAHRHPDWHCVILCPGYIIGAYDARPSSGRMLLAAYRRRLMVAPRGGKAFVAASDVAEAAVNALTLGEHGQRYIVCNSHECLAISDLYRLQASVMGYRQRVLTLPAPLVAVAGWLGDGLRALGIRTALSSCNVRQLQVREYYDNSHGISCLRYPQTPMAEAVATFHQWRTENP